MALTVAAYAGLLSAGFVYEDWRGPVGSAFDWTGMVRDHDTHHPLLTSRQLTMLTWAIDRWVSGRPWQAHLTSVLIHLGNGWLAYRLAAALGARASSWVAAALVWLHPMQVEAVAYTAARADLLATTWTLAACLAVARGRWGWAWSAAWLTGHAKESGFVVVPLMGLVWLMVRPNAAIVRTLRRPPVVVAGVTILVALGYVVTTMNHYPEGLTVVDDLTWRQYWAGQLIGTLRFAGMTLVPVGQTVDPDIYPLLMRQAAASPWVLAGSVGMVVAAGWRVWRSRAPWAFAVLWVALALSSRAVVYLSEWLSEHQWYLPLTGIALGVAIWCGRRLDIPGRSA